MWGGFIRGMTGWCGSTVGHKRNVRRGGTALGEALPTGVRGHFMVAKHVATFEGGTQPHQSAAPWEGPALPGGRMRP